MQFDLYSHRGYKPISHYVFFSERTSNMRAEIAALTQEIKQSLELLRRHL